MDSDKTLTCTGTANLVPIENAWTQPALSANGTMGGSSMACTQTNRTSGYSAWMAFALDPDKRTVAGNTISASGGRWALIFYTPDAIKISKIEWSNNPNNINGNFTEGYFQGSNTNNDEDYVNLIAIANDDTSAGARRTLNVNSSNYYNYHRFYVTACSAEGGGTNGYPCAGYVVITGVTYGGQTTVYDWTIVES